MLSSKRLTPSRAAARLRRQGGFMLIEALIAILIFSIGILGIVGLQAAAVNQSTDARYRSEAAFSRRFQRHFGVTPGRYRRDVRRDQRLARPQLFELAGLGQLP